MRKLIQNTASRGDCTAGYAVILNKAYTVKEFIDEVLTGKEWGYIGIYRRGSIFGDPNCEYKWGKLISELPSEIMDKTILEVTADGGYSCMNYLLKLT